INLKEAGKTTALDVVEAESVADDVLAEDLAAIILDLVVALRSTLGCQQVRAYGETPDVDAHRIVRKRKTGTAGGILNLVLELQVREADGVSETAGIEIQAHHFVPRVVLVLVHLEAGRKECSVHLVLEIVVTGEQTGCLGQFVIQPAHQFGFFEWSLEGSGVRSEWGHFSDWCGKVLQGALAISKEEQFIFDDRAAEAGALLIALIGRWDCRAFSGCLIIRRICGIRRRRQSRCFRAVAEGSVGFAVEGVGSGLGSNVYRTRRSQIVGKVEGGLRQRKLLNAAGRNIFSGGTDGLVADVDAVYVDAGSASEASAEGDRRVADLGRVEIRAVLNLDARLKLGEIEEVAAVDGQVGNLIRAQHALHLRLLGVDLYGAGANLNGFTGLSDLQFHIAVRRVINLHNEGQPRALKPRGFHFHHVIAGHQSTGGILAGGIALARNRLVGSCVGDRHRGAADYRSGRVGDLSLNAARADGGLGEQCSAGSYQEKGSQGQNYYHAWKTNISQHHRLLMRVAAD